MNPQLYALSLYWYNFRHAICAKRLINSPFTGSAMDWFRGVSRGLLQGWLGAVCVLSVAGNLHSQTATKDAPATVKSLDTTGASIAPDDVAFFASSINLRKGWQHDFEAGWIAELRRVPYIQSLEQFIQQQWDSPQPQAEQVKNFLSSPIVRNVLLLLSDMASQECFFYGESDWCGAMEAFASFQYDIAQYAEDPEGLREYIMSIEKSEIDAIPFPTTVVGFQLKDTENARTQLDALEGVVQLALAGVEQLKPFAKGVRRKDLKNGQVLTVSLRVADIPWESMQVPGDAKVLLDHVVSLIQDRQIVLSLGVIDSRMYIAFSEATDTLTTLGQGDSLADSEVMSQLSENIPEDLRNISYSSGEWRAAGWELNFGSYFERIASQLSSTLINDPSLDNADDDKLIEWQEQVLDGAEWLDEKVIEMMPEFEPQLAYSFVTADGHETLAYDWTPSFLLENAKPLSVTSHGGTNPLMLLAVRQLWLDDIGEMVDGVIDEIPDLVIGYMEAAGRDEGQVKRAQSVLDGVLPIVDGIVTSIRTKVCAAMDGNESLTAISAGVSATSLGEDAVTPPVPLPLPEVAVVLKIKNRDLFLTGIDDVVRGINDLMDFAKQQPGSNLSPNAKVPEAQEESMKGGGVRYSLQASLPAPFDQFELQMALSNDVAIFGYSTRQVDDLYETRRLSSRPAWFTGEKPTAAVGFVNFAKIVQSIRPWVHYALAIQGRPLDEPIMDAPAGAPVPTGSDLLQIWDTFKKLGKAAGTTVIDENDVTVSHWIWVAE